MKAKVALVASLVAAHANIAHAASFPVVIEKRNEAAKTCGLSESQLESLAVRTLESSQLQPDTNADGWLHVHVTVNQARRNRCAAHIAVQMKASAKPLPAGRTANPRQRSRVPDVALCNEGGDYSAAKAAFPLEIESAAEYSINQCLGSLKY